VLALREAAQCADNVKAELETMRKMMKSGFAQRPPEEGPPSEVPLTRQQGRLAIAMDEESHRQTSATERALGLEVSAPAADAIRRKRVQEATQMGGALIGALAANPLRLFDTTDGDLTFMLWGAERSMVRLQAAMSRGAKAKRAAEEGSAASDGGNGGVGRGAGRGDGRRPSTVPPGATRSGITAREQELLAAAARPPTRSREVTERMMSWGDDGTLPPEEIHTPITDKLINTVKERAVL
jgi:hypothetical protein